MASAAVKRAGLAGALADTAGLLVFTAVGIAMHGAGFTAGPILRNVVPFVGLWFLLAPLTRIYRRPGWRTVLLHWAIVIPLAVVVRQWWVGRLVSRATVAFLIASLILTLVLTLAGRLLLWLAHRSGRRRHLGTRPRGGARPTSGAAR